MAKANFERFKAFSEQMKAKQQAKKEKENPDYTAPAEPKKIGLSRSFWIL